MEKTLLASLKVCVKTCAPLGGRGMNGRISPEVFFCSIFWCFWSHKKKEKKFSSHNAHKASAAAKRVKEDMTCFTAIAPFLAKPLRPNLRCEMP